MAKVQNKKIQDENELLKLIKMIVIVGVIALAFYLLTVFVNKKEETKPEETKKTATIQYDEILVGNIFSQKPTNYYVLIEDNNDENVNTYETYLTIYKSKENAKRVYTAVLNNLFNIKYMDTTSNINNDINKFKVSGTTLVEIKNGKIVKAYEKEEDILKQLQDLTK